MNKKSPNRKPRKRNKQTSRRGWWIALAVIGVLLIGLCAYALPTVSDRAEQTALVRVPAGATEQTLADTLTKYFGADYSAAAMRAVKGMNREVASRHGAYLIEEGTTPLMAARKIMRGMQSPVRLTINGFRKLDDLTGRIGRKMEFGPDSLASLLARPGTLDKYGLTPDQAIALFLDDTYEVYWSDTPQHVVDKIGSHYLDVWNDIRKAKAAEIGLTPAEIMTLCSIVDEETNKADEKGAVGRLYINRLKKGMRLQADPTVRYALGDFTIKRVAGPMLQLQSPYNTYVVKGLPPGPIRTTRVETIDAVLDSEPHNYLYMCAKSDFSGYHDFATTFDEHMANARRYQAELNRRNITAKADSL